MKSENRLHHQNTEISVEDAQLQIEYQENHDTNDPNMTAYLYKRIDDLENELGLTKNALYQKDAEIITLKQHIERLKKQNVEDAEIREIEVFKITKRLDKQIEETNECKNELMKAINMIDLINNKSSRIKVQKQEAEMKLRMSNQFQMRLQNAVYSNIKRWIIIIAEQKINHEKVVQGRRIGDKYTLIKALKVLKRNTYLEKAVKIAQIRYKINLKLKAFDCMKYFKILNQHKQARKITATEFDDFRIKRKVYERLVKYHKKYNLPQTILSQKLSMAAEYHDQKQRQRYFKYIKTVTQTIFKQNRLNKEIADKFHRRHLFSNFVSNVKVARVRLELNESRAFKQIVEKRQYNLKVMAFSSLLWERNVRLEQKLHAEKQNRKSNKLLLKFYFRKLVQGCKKQK